MTDRPEGRSALIQEVEARHRINYRSADLVCILDGEAWPCAAIRHEYGREGVTALEAKPLTPAEIDDLFETRRKGLFLPSEVRTELIDRLLATVDRANNRVLAAHGLRFGDEDGVIEWFTAYLADMERQWEANAAGDESVLPVLAEVRSIRLYWTNLSTGLAATPEDQS